MNKHRKHNAGFTLLETLAVVAIVSVLLAVSAAGVLRYRAHLQITELDNAARELYMAAQNRAVLLKNSYRLSHLLQNTLPEGLSGTGAGANTCYYINRSAAALDELLPEGSVDAALLDGRFYIVYEPVSGSVTDVFFAKTGELPTLETAFQKKDAGRGERMRGDPMLGWYGGGSSVEVATRPLPAPGVEIRIDNGDELMLTVCYTVPGGLPAGVSYLPEVTLDYPTGAGSLRPQLLAVNALGTTTALDADGRFAESGAFAPGNKVTYTWVLDSLRPGQQFRRLLPGYETIDSADHAPALGKDFAVTAALTLRAAGYVDSTYSATATGNSLFDSLADGGATAKISNLRHLQNLDNLYSWAAQVNRAVQVAEIDAGTYLGAAYAFLPISNWDLKKYEVQRPAADAEPYAVTNLTVTDPPGGRNGGLFSAVGGFTFRDVRLKKANITAARAGGLVGSAPGSTFINCQVVESTVTARGNQAGGIVGWWWTEPGLPEKLVFEDCSVRTLTVSSSSSSSSSSSGGIVGCGPKLVMRGCRAEDVIVSNPRNAGGMVGYETGGAVFKDCNVLAIVARAPSGTAGGLIGTAGTETTTTPADFRMCNAYDVTVSALNYAGGLVGKVLTTAGYLNIFSNCSARDAEVSAAGEWAASGGLVGWASYVRLRRCYSTLARVSAPGFGGGLVGDAEDCKFNKCDAMNAAVRYTGGGLIKNAGGLVGRARAGAAFDNCKVYLDRNDPYYPLTGVTADTWLIAGGRAGGLVGKLEDGTIENSLAATQVSGTEYTGGLVGEFAYRADLTAGSLTIKRSYASCRLRSGSGATHVGGLIGLRDKAELTLTLENVYAAGFIDGAGGYLAAGLCGGERDSGVTATNVYAAIRYTNAPNIHPLVYALRVHREQETKCYFLHFDGASYAGTWGASLADAYPEARAYADLRNVDLGSAFQLNGETHPYNLDGVVHGLYPFPTLAGMPHYGDWYVN